MTERDSAAARDGDERIGLGGLAGFLHGLEVQPGEVADDFQVAEFFGADIHEEVFAGGIVAVESLDGILHGGGEFAVGAAELFEEHVAEARIGRIDVNGIHELLYVMVHAREICSRSAVVGKHPRGSCARRR